MRFAGTIAHCDGRADRGKTVVAIDLVAIGNEKRDPVAAAASTEKSGELEFLAVIDCFRLQLLRNPIYRLIGELHSDPP